MNFFDKHKKRIWGIKRDTLRLILEVSRDSHPREFAGVLRAREGVVTEILLLPGTFSSSRHAIMQLHMLPIDFSVVGTVHSHPSPSLGWSREDLYLFQKFGRIHIIASYPYNEESWCAYDFYGNKVELEVID